MSEGGRRKGFGVGAGEGRPRGAHVLDLLVAHHPQGEQMGSPPKGFPVHSCWRKQSKQLLTSPAHPPPKPLSLSVAAPLVVRRHQ